MTLVTELLSRMPSTPVQIVTVTCATTSPLTVYIAGDDTAVPAVQITNPFPFTSGQSGYALWSSGMPPICFKTTT